MTSSRPASSLPYYATITPSGASTYVWAKASSPQALQTPDGIDRRSQACWYSVTSFSVNVNLTDGQQHLLSVYADDYDNKGRSETIQVIDANTSMVLDTETISSFTGGIYLDWVVSGNIVHQGDAGSAGPNALISGIFLDPPVPPSSSGANQATWFGADAGTQGNWIGTYGSQGYDVINNGSSLPSYATVTPSGELPYTWPSTSSPLALQDAVGSGRIEACWYSKSSFSVNVNLTDGLDSPPVHLHRRLRQLRAERADPDQRRLHGRRIEHRRTSRRSPRGPIWSGMSGAISW